MFEADAVVGCDGVRSKIRELTGDDPPATWPIGALIEALSRTYRQALRPHFIIKTVCTAVVSVI